MLVSLALRSSIELTGTLCQTSTMPTSNEGVPSQLNLTAS